jgi:hypothetical protein
MPDWVKVFGYRTLQWSRGCGRISEDCSLQKQKSKRISNNETGLLTGFKYRQETRMRSTSIRLRARIRATVTPLRGRDESF